MAKVIIDRGEDKNFTIKLRLGNGDPFNLTGNTEVTLCMKKSDNTFTTFTLTGGKIAISGSALLGVLAVTLLAADTADLKLGDLQDYELKEAKGAVIKKVLFKQGLEVRDSNC